MDGGQWSVFGCQERFWIDLRDRDQFRVSGTVIVVVVVFVFVVVRSWALRRRVCGSDRVSVASKCVTGKCSA